jgi:MFS family permease
MDGVPGIGRRVGKTGGIGGAAKQVASRNSLILINVLRNLRGNPKACVFTEPLWGLSMNLCLPYASVYMLALGLRDADIGLVTTVYMLSQVVFGLLGGIITDKLGRRLTTAVFDFFAWCIPCVIWFLAKDFWFFFGAALVNGMMKITQNSWDCLLVEDAEKEQITKIYSLVIICGQLSALFAPIASILVARLTLVPAVRILYINAFIVMTTKIILLYVFSRETGTGIIRKRETKGKSLFALLAGYGGVLKIIGKSRGTIFSLVIAALVGAVNMVNVTFWQVIASRRLSVPDALLPLFPMFRSILAIVFLFTVIPRLLNNGAAGLKRPLLIGFAAYIVGQAILIITPGGLGPATCAILCVSLVFDGFGNGSLMMLAESLVALYVNKAERARVMAIQHMVIMLATAPFGWIGGLLSGVSRTLPFALNILLLSTGIIVTICHHLPWRRNGRGLQ